MKFKAPGRKKKNKSNSNANEEDVAKALADLPKPEEEAPAAEAPAAEEPAEEAAPEEPAAEEPAAEEAAPEEPAAPEEAAPEEAAPEEAAPEEAAPEEPAAEEPAAEEAAPEEPVEEASEEPAALEDEPPIPEESPDSLLPEDMPSTPVNEEPEASGPEASEPEAEEPEAEEQEPEEVDVNLNHSLSHQESQESEEGVSVELSPIKALTGILKKGPYFMPNASPKTQKTLRKQKWHSQFCRVDPHLNQIFCCDKDRAKLYQQNAPITTDGKCSFYHFNVHTKVEEGMEEDPKAKEFSFKITGLNGCADNYLSMSAGTAEARDTWCKIIRRAVNRMHIDQDRVGDHTKLRQMLTGQEAEISILEEELEKMAVVAGECSGRAALAEEKLALKEVECGDLNSKLQLSHLEVGSLKSQLAIMEERTRNLTILADDVNGVTAEEVERAKLQMQEQRAARLKAIQLEIGADEDYLEKYKKYLNAKRDSVLQKHGSQFSLTSVGCPKVSPSAANAPLSLN